MRNVTKENGAQRTDNILIVIHVEGVANDKSWDFGLEFYYANEESFYCRPVPLDESTFPDRMQVPEAARSVDVAFLPPMSGLATLETRLDQGAINVRVGEGRTADVLRNLCHNVHTDDADRWGDIVNRIEKLFGARLEPPAYIEERGEIVMRYREGSSTLDLSASGRGLQQTLLILAYMAANPKATILLDEPDAHLEILRQRQIYNDINEIAEAQGTQIIAASHSEVLLNEAAARDLVIAFVGEPHRMDGRSDQVRKALATIGYEQYLQAELTGWVLYLEGSTDLAILQEFARRLNHAAAIRALERPFVHYVGNMPKLAEKHFF
ncbi:MAG: AAA family ATPase [Rhodobacteraceae bacterium]|nr:AAA family ATPase [Paracoccaceae bacterium]